MTTLMSRGTKHQPTPGSVRPGPDVNRGSAVVDGFLAGNKDPLEARTGERSPPVCLA
jgi:hypothetical protein